MFKRMKKEKEQNELRFYTNCVYRVLFGIFLLGLLGLFILFLSSNGDSNSMFIFGKRPTLIITGSMEPAVAVNSIVMLEPVKYEDIKEGDIIRYTSENGYSVLHRVRHKDSERVITQGDANDLPDGERVTPDKITGKVTDIHNEFAGLITLIFGRFSMENTFNSVVRMCLGIFILVLVLFLFIVCFIVLFEMLSDIIFFKRMGKKLIVKSNYWVDKVKSKEEEVEIFNDFFEKYEKSNIFKRFILAFKFRKYYNGLCNIEREVLKTEKRLKSLQDS